MGRVDLRKMVRLRSKVGDSMNAREGGGERDSPATDEESDNEDENRWW